MNRHQTIKVHFIYLFVPITMLLQAILRVRIKFIYISDVILRNILLISEHEDVRLATFDKFSDESTSRIRYQQWNIDIRVVAGFT